MELPRLPLAAALEASAARDVRLSQLLARAERLPAGVHREALHGALEGEWKALSQAQRRARLSFALDTGYVLLDRGPRPVPGDTSRWSEAEIARLAEIFDALPDSLKRLPSLQSITRVHVVPGGESESMLRRRVDGFGGLGKRAGGVLGHARALLAPVPGPLGAARQATGELLLGTKIFEASSLPGTKLLLDNTVMHELGHHVLYSRPKLAARWSEFFQAVAMHEPPNRYFLKNAGEGFSVGLGFYGMGPKLLAKKSPRTFEFMQGEFADGFAAWARGRGTGQGPRAEAWLMNLLQEPTTFAPW